MAIQGALPVSFSTVFPHGAFALGVEAITDFETKRPQMNKDTGLPLWAVDVIAASPEAASGRGGSAGSLRPGAHPAALGAPGGVRHGRPRASFHRGTWWPAGDHHLPESVVMGTRASSERR